MREETKKLVMAALLAALVCLATYVVKIPSPFKGYLNLGDGIVLLAGWLLPLRYGFLAAGIGSALADLFSGYGIYAPVTFVIKGLMALMVGYGFTLLRAKMRPFAARLIPAVAAEVMMVAGYYLFEGVLYGFILSAVNILPNAVQGAAGLVLGILLVKALEKSGISR